MGNPYKGVQQQAEVARQSEVARQADTRGAIGRVDETFRQFDDPFFAGREQAYSNYAMPQVSDQYDTARKNLIFALADGGLTRSSVGAQRLGDLERDYSLRRQDVADQARGYGQQARTDVESARSGLVSQANSVGDAAASGNAALNEANRLTAAPSFSPLGALFQNVTAGIGVSRAAGDAERLRNAGGAQGARLFQPSRGSGQVVQSNV